IEWKPFTSHSEFTLVIILQKALSGIHLDIRYSIDIPRARSEQGVSPINGDFRSSRRCRTVRYPLILHERSSEKFCILDETFKTTLSEISLPNSCQRNWTTHDRRRSEI